MLHLEVLVALRAAEAEALAVVPHEHNAMAGVDVAGAEPAPRCIILPYGVRRIRAKNRIYA